MGRTFWGGKTLVRPKGGWEGGRESGRMGGKERSEGGGGGGGGRGGKGGRGEGMGGEEREYSSLF